MTDTQTIAPDRLLNNRSGNVTMGAKAAATALVARVTQLRRDLDRPAPVTQTWVDNELAHLRRLINALEGELP